MNERNYLDDNGLATVLTALKNLFPLKTDIPNDIGFVSGGYSAPLVLTTLKKGFYILSSIGTLYYKADESGTRKNYNDNNSGCPFAMLLTRDFENTQTTYQLGYILTYADDGRITYYDLNWNITQLWAISGKISNNYGSLLTGAAQTFYGNKTFEQFPVTPSSAPTTNYQTANKKYVDDQVATKTIQYTTMPTASADNLSNIVQYIGATDSTYTNGYFYECVSDGQDPATYSWEEVEVQTTPEAVPTVVAATHANNFDMLNAAPGYYISTNVSDFYYNIQGEYHTNRPVPFFTVVKNIKDAVYQETFAYGLYFEKNSSYDGGIGLVTFEKYNNTYANVYYNSLIMGINGGSQYWYGTKTFGSIPKVASYTTPTQDTELTAKKYVDDSGTALLSNVAPGYDSTATYSVGDYVTYNRILYKCNTAISTAEDWTAAHWTQTTVMAELNSTVGNINTTLATLATPSNNGGGA